MSVGSELGLQKEAKVFRSGANLQLLTGERPSRQLRQQFASEDDSFLLITFRTFLTTHKKLKFRKQLLLTLLRRH